MSYHSVFQHQCLLIPFGHSNFALWDLFDAFVEAHGPVRDLLRAEGLEEKVGVISRFSSLAELMKDRDEMTKP